MIVNCYRENFGTNTVCIDKHSSKIKIPVAPPFFFTAPRKKEKEHRSNNANRRYVFHHAKWLPLRSCIYAFINIRRFEGTVWRRRRRRRSGREILFHAEKISVEKYGTVVARLLLAGSQGLGRYPQPPRYIGRAV